MHIKHFIYPILIIALMFASCQDPVAPGEDEYGQIGLIKTAVFNDENDDGSAQAGETITYYFQIKNTGTVDLTDITLTDSTIGVDSMIIEDVSTLTGGQSVNVEIVFTLTEEDIQVGSISNQATVTAKDSFGHDISDLSDDNDFSENDPTVTEFAVITDGPYFGGAFVCNQGNFGLGNATLTYIDTESNLVQNAYQTVNGEALGDTAQSIYFYGDFGYIVVNNSHKVIVVNRYTLQQVTVIEGDSINNPRYFIADGDNGYISNWGDAADPDDDFITVINLLDNSVTTTIPVGQGPENMLVQNGQLYVALQGGWGYGHELAVINTSNNTVSITLDLGGDVPNSMAQDANGDLWVLCGGKPSWSDDETHGKLLRISNGTIDFTHDFNTTEHPAFLSFDSGKLYFYLNSKIYATLPGDNASEYEEVSGMDGFYYYVTTHNGKLYALDALDYVSEGNMKIFDLTSGAETATYSVGIIPGYVGFNE